MSPGIRIIDASDTHPEPYMRERGFFCISCRSDIKNGTVAANTILLRNISAICKFYRQMYMSGY